MAESQPVKQTRQPSSDVPASTCSDKKQDLFVQVLKQFDSSHANLLNLSRKERIEHRKKMSLTKPKKTKHELAKEAKRLRESRMKEAEKRRPKKMTRLRPVSKQKISNNGELRKNQPSKHGVHRVRTPKPKMPVKQTQEFEHRKKAEKITRQIPRKNNTPALEQKRSHEVTRSESEKLLSFEKQLEAQQKQIQQLLKLQYLREKANALQHKRAANIQLPDAKLGNSSYLKIYSEKQAEKSTEVKNIKSQLESELKKARAEKIRYQKMTEELSKRNVSMSEEVDVQMKEFQKMKLRETKRLQKLRDELATQTKMLISLPSKKERKKERDLKLEIEKLEKELIEAKSKNNLKTERLKNRISQLEHSESENIEKLRKLAILQSKWDQNKEKLQKEVRNWKQKANLYEKRYLTLEKKQTTSFSTHLSGSNQKKFEEKTENEEPERHERPKHTKNPNIQINKLSEYLETIDSKAHMKNIPLHKTEILKILYSNNEVFSHSDSPQTVEKEDGKTLHEFSDGSSKCWFENGTALTTFIDGTVLITFSNGDRRITFSNHFNSKQLVKKLEEILISETSMSEALEKLYRMIIERLSKMNDNWLKGCQVYYYDKNGGIIQATYPNQTEELFFLSNLQKEIHFVDGTKQVYFPDKSMRYVRPS